MPEAPMICSLLIPLQMATETVTIKPPEPGRRGVGTILFHQHKEVMMTKGQYVPSETYHQLDARAAKEEVDRLLDDPRLRMSTRNKAFLRYLAEQYGDGDPNPVKAYVIAIDVFGRPDSFNPELDPIVRIEASRLRAELERYYSTYTDCSDVRVTVPRGFYLVEFSRNKTTTTRVGSVIKKAVGITDPRSALARIRSVCDNIRQKLNWQT